MIYTWLMDFFCSVQNMEKYFAPNDSSFNKNIYVKLDYKNLDTSIYKADEKEIADVHSNFIKRIMIQSKLSNVDVYDVLIRLDENFSKTD